MHALLIGRALTLIFVPTCRFSILGNAPSVFCLPVCGHSLSDEFEQREWLFLGLLKHESPSPLYSGLPFVSPEKGEKGTTFWIFQARAEKISTSKESCRSLRPGLAVQFMQSMQAHMLRSPPSLMEKNVVSLTSRSSSSFITNISSSSSSVDRPLLNSSFSFCFLSLHNLRISCCTSISEMNHL